MVETYTTTSNGEVVIVTSTAYVPGEPDETAAPDEARPTPGLQNAAPAARRPSSGGWLAAGAAVAAAAAVLPPWA